MKTIRLAPISFPNLHAIDLLAERIEQTLHLKTIVTMLPVDIEQAFDPHRTQYHSSKLLSAILSTAPLDDSKLIAVVNRDLFVPILTFVFGEAQLNNRAAICSSLRLANEFYGLQPNPVLEQERLEKEALHELGHTFGLKHCFEAPCVMNVSTYVEDIDIKPLQYCERCMFQLSKHFA